MKIQTPYIYIQPLEGAFVCPRSFHGGVSKREATMGFLTSLCLLAIFKTKYQMLVVVHPQSDENVRLQWGF